MQFVPRKTPPSNNNLYYIKTTHGGYNKCIVIDRDTGSVLPNCTGYAYGRFMECQGVTTCRLSRANGGAWYGHTSDGYDRGLTPKLGAVICWSSTRSGGHVAIVEEIKDNGKIVVSNSAYNGKRFFLSTLNPPNYKFGSAYTLQGFIYNPTDFNPEPPTPEPSKQKKKFPWVLYAKKLRNKR